MGLPDLQADKEGLCSLRLDDRVTITMECNEASGVLVFSAVLGTLAPYQTKSFYPHLLEANLFWKETGGATLGVDPATLNVFLCQQEKFEEMPSEYFQEVLKKFSDTALSWNTRLSESTESLEENLPETSLSEETASSAARPTETYA